MRSIFAVLAVASLAVTAPALQVTGADNSASTAQSFKDPNHRNCPRSVYMEGDKVKISGADGDSTNDGHCDDAPVLENVFEVEGTRTGDKIVMDFSAKGGPKDLTGTLSADLKTITWQDGNQWTEIERIETAPVEDKREEEEHSFFSSGWDEPELLNAVVGENEAPLDETEDLAAAENEDPDAPIVEAPAVEEEEEGDENAEVSEFEVGGVEDFPESVDPDEKVEEVPMEEDMGADQGPMGDSPNPPPTTPEQESPADLPADE